METVNPICDAQSSVSGEAATLFISLELSRARWLVTSLSPGSSKISRHFVVGGDSRDLLRLLADLRAKAERNMGATVKIVTIQEIGFDGFWIHRILASNAIESHVVEAASIAVPRRRRRAKTDTIDGELLLRTLMAFKRGEPQVCAMVVVPSPDEEDQRRLSRERKTMIKERIEHINRIKGLMACQGITGFEPMRANARERLGELRTGDGRAIPERMKAEIRRELDRLALLRQQRRHRRGQERPGDQSALGRDPEPGHSAGPHRRGRPQHPEADRHRLEQSGQDGQLQYYQQRELDHADQSNLDWNALAGDGHNRRTRDRGLRHRIG